MKPRITRQRHTERDGGGDLGFAGRETDHVKCHFAKRAGRERWWDEKTSLGGIDASDQNLGRLPGETTVIFSPTFISRRQTTTPSAWLPTSPTVHCALSCRAYMGSDQLQTENTFLVESFVRLPHCRCPKIRGAELQLIASSSLRYCGLNNSPTARLCSVQCDLERISICDDLSGWRMGPLASSSRRISTRTVSSLCAVR